MSARARWSRPCCCAGSGSARRSVSVQVTYAAWAMGSRQDPAQGQGRQEGVSDRRRLALGPAAQAACSDPPRRVGVRLHRPLRGIPNRGRCGTCCRAQASTPPPPAAPHVLRAAPAQRHGRPDGSEARRPLEHRNHAALPRRGQTRGARREPTPAPRVPRRARRRRNVSPSRNRSVLDVRGGAL